MPREKSIIHHVNKITASSSNNDNDNHESLGVDKKETLEVQASTHDFASLSAMPQCKGGSLHSGIPSPACTRSNRRTTFQCKFVLVSQRRV
jgi:hypothetical protein